MGKAAEKKRKLEQEQLDSVTPKRLKPSTTDSSKKATPKTNGAADSPMVVVSRNEQDNNAQSTPKPSKAERKAAKKERHASMNAQATPGAQLRAESDDVVTPVDKRKELGKELAEEKSAVNGANEQAQKAESKQSKKKKKRHSESAKETASQTTAAVQLVKEELDEESLLKLKKSADKKARRKANRAGEVILRDTHQRQEIFPSKQNGWTMSAPSAGRYIDHDPIFVTDENGEPCLIAATMSEVQLLSLSTSLIVRSHIRGTSCITAFVRSPTDDASIEIAYQDGTKVRWNWITGNVIDGTFPGEESVTAMTSAVLADGQSELFYISRTEGVFNVVGERKVLKTTDRVLTGIQVLHNGAYIICTSGGALLIGARKDPAAQSEYTWVDVPLGRAITCADARLVFKDASKKAQRRRPDLMIAVGTGDGKIFLYSNLATVCGSQGTDELPTPQQLHWHRERVSSVKFSRDGNYLISGGKETVLVLWQLETGKQQFLPHLTAQIEHIVVSPEGDRYALQMGENSIMVLSTSELKPVANFAGLQLPVLTEQLAAEDALLARTSALLHPQDPHKLILSVPATQPKSSRDIQARPFLQSFDIRNSRHLSRQALARNTVTDFNVGPDKRPILPPDVSLVALSPDGEWMATVDEWELPETDLEHLVPNPAGLGPEDILKLEEEQQARREVYLKFWRWSATQQVWTLSTRADGPHSITTDEDPKLGAGRVLKLAADPSSNRFATIGQDSVVKIWTSKTRLRGGVPLKEEDGTDAIDWVCKKTVAVPVASERQDSPMELLDEAEKTFGIEAASLAFTPDGSMLACAPTAGNDTESPLIHFIDAHTGSLKSSKAGLAAPGREIIDIGFVDRYFVALSAGAIRVWDLINDDHHYTILLPGEPEHQAEAMLAINNYDETFAVVSYALPTINDPKPIIRVFSPKNPTALYEQELGMEPATILAPQNAAGFTILFGDATIRTLSATSTSAIVAATPATDAPRDALIAIPSAETTLALAQAGPRQEDIDMDDATAFALSGDITAPRQAIEDDKPVVRPEQLNAILDVGEAFAMPALTEMFASMASLHSRAPRRRERVEKVEM